jgi:hypothetical protein
MRQRWRIRASNSEALLATFISADPLMKYWPQALLPFARIVASSEGTSGLSKRTPKRLASTQRTVPVAEIDEQVRVT